MKIENSAANGSLKATPARKYIFLTFGVMACLMLNILASSCGGAKQGVSTSPVPLPTGQVIPSGQPGVVSEWTTLSIPVKVKLISPKKLSCSAKATMVRGSETTISLRMLGMEVGCIHFDTDSFMVYEKLNHTMIVEPMSAIERHTGLDVTDLQDLILGTGDIDALLMTARAYLDRAEMLSDNPQATPYGDFPGRVSVSVAKGNLVFDASFEWDYKKARWNEPVSAFKPPVKQNYTRLSLSKLAEIFKQ